MDREEADEAFLVRLVDLLLYGAMPRDAVAVPAAGPTAALATGRKRRSGSA
jgi:hypothetical protein